MAAGVHIGRQLRRACSGGSAGDPGNEVVEGEHAHKAMLSHPASQPFHTSPDLCSELPGGCAARVKIAVEWWVTIALFEAFNQCREICAGLLLKVLWRTPFRQSTVHAD